MRIIIDMQGVQMAYHSGDTDDETMSLLKSIVRNRGEHEVLLTLNGLLPDSVGHIRSAFDGLLSQDKIHIWYAPYLSIRFGKRGTAKEVQEIIRHSFWLNLNPDSILVTDNFELQECISNFDSTQIVQIRLENKPTLTTEAYIADLLSSVAYPKAEPLTVAPPTVRPRLAYVSPLPPEKSGIADYSAELLLYLEQFYAIDIVVEPVEINSDKCQGRFHTISPEEFKNVAHQYERILYHFGNNPMHVKMFELLYEFPGVVVLHDFFLSGVQWYRETYGFAKNSLWNELYLSHGYKAVQQRSHEGNETVTFRYPCNFSVLQNSHGIIVHSEYSRSLASKWYGQSDNFEVIPLLRKPPVDINRDRARQELGFAQNDFVVCSFGFIGKTKQNHRLLDAWEGTSVLNGDDNCKLIYVGDMDESPYCIDFSKRVQKFRKTGNVKISGWTDTNTYRMYLAAADVAVQLRTLSRGETSAAVLDCLNYGVATIINSNGSMADIPDEVVKKIPDDFTDSDLISALEIMRKDPEWRIALAERGLNYLRTAHDPVHCAESYVQKIEQFYSRKQTTSKCLVKNLACVLPTEIDDQLLVELANALALSFSQKSSARSLFLDVSVVVRDDFKTGIQRVVRALTLALIDSPPEGFRIEPVYLTNEGGTWHYRYARDYTLNLLHSAVGWIGNEPIEAQPGDILLGLDLAGGYVIQADRDGVYRNLKNRGVQVSFVVYDLIPIQFENIYPPGFKEGHAEWLRIVAQMNSAICISKSVADELSSWVEENVPEGAKKLDIRWFHLGADLETSSPTRGLPENASKVLDQFKSMPTFLMVGTVEPRKGHLSVIHAFESLWADNQDVNLVVVGKAGWMVGDLTAYLRQHAEMGKRLFWLESISDEYLEKVYSASTCLIAASRSEGFGLPLIEGAQHGLPIIARDIPVFREVAGECAFYFPNDDSPSVLAHAILRWRALFAEGQHPKSENMSWLTWKQSAQQLKDALVNETFRNKDV